MTGFVSFDKPEGITSFIASARVKRILGAKKSGHTGTLDPMATGVMVVALGGATRFIELIPDHDKAYVARFRLGIATDTLDITGKVLTESTVTAKKEDVEKSLDSFRGEIKQLPPMYSAIKKDGVRLYDLARQGIEIEREERIVNILSLELTGEYADNEYEITVECSKGTYIRSLISDIGEALGCGAAMTSLRRIKANSVPIERCFTLEALSDMAEKGEAEKAVVRVEDFLSFPKITVSEAQAKRFSNGGELDLKRLRPVPKETGYYRIFSPEGSFLGVGEVREGEDVLFVKRVYVDL